MSIYSPGTVLPVSYTHLLGAGNVGNVAGNVGNAAGNVGIGSPMSRMLPGGYSRSQALEEMKMFLEATAEAAKERGMGVLVEALNPGERCV